jgi:uncharacterized protein YrzB (UPF0473 family)
MMENMVLFNLKTKDNEKRNFMSNHNNDHVHGPDCDHDHELETDVIIFTDEQGEEHEMIIVYTFETNDKGYAVLIDRNDPEQEGLIFRIKEDGEEVTLENIEDETEWQHVEKIYNEINEKEESK